MRHCVRTAALAIALALFAVSYASSAELPGLQALEGIGERLAAAASLPEPSNLRVIDRPGDDGTALLVLFDITVPEGQVVYVMPQVRLQGGSVIWQNASEAPILVDAI